MTAAADPRRIEYLRLDSLKADPRNPKAHDLATIDASVGRFGYIEPIVRDDRTGFIVSGHGRTKTLTAMHERGETPPEGVKVTQDGHWLVPVGVGWSSRTDSEAAAALIALNRTTELGGWVDDALLDLLDSLTEEEDGLAGVGFTEADRAVLEALVHKAGPEDPEHLEDDEFDQMVQNSSDTTLVIKDVTAADVSAFRSLPGETDVDRLRALLRLNP